MTSCAQPHRRGWMHLIVACVALVSGGLPAFARAEAGVPPPTPDDGGCTVSALLVPSCGAWLGTSPPSSGRRTDFATGLSEYEAVARNVPDILHFYKTDAASFPTPDEIALSQRDGQQASLLFYNWKPSTSLSWREIAEGAADQNIHVVAESLRQYQGRLFLGIHHEPENDQGQPGSGRTPADYVDMYRYVVQQLRAEGVNNVVYVMNFMGFAGWSDVADDFYPGDDVVDWIAYDPYAHAGQSTFASLLNRPTGKWPGFYDWAVRRAPDKPIMLGEWGFDLASQPAAPEALDGAVEALQTRFPNLKALVYWNSMTDEFNYRIDQEGELARAYGEAYSRMANDPYFNSTSVAAAAGVTVVIPPPTTLPVAPAPTEPPVVTAPTTTTQCHAGVLASSDCVDTSVVPDASPSPTSVPEDAAVDSLSVDSVIVDRSRASSSYVALASVAVLGIVFVRRRRRRDPFDPR